MASLSRGTWLSEEELRYLFYGLRLEAGAALQKRTLQRLCEWYEKKRLLTDAAPVRQLIHSLMHARDTLVRRWSMKALALIGHHDDFHRIVDRLRVEEDGEAQTWGVTGLVKNADGRDLRELRELANLPDSAAITLAARLYAPDSWIARSTKQPVISLSNAEITLKWSTFLIGYGRAPEDLFHPRFSNEVFLGELNVHDADDISEYSVWALWERQELGAGHSRIPLLEASRRPESVRKWIYRLATRSPTQAGLDPDCLAELRRDRSARAREGLALGVSELPPPLFGGAVMDWASVEDDPQVVESLLASMASRSAEFPEYGEAVRQRFQAAAVDSPLRGRLLAASQGAPLYGDLRRAHIASSVERQGLLEYDRPIVIGEVRLNSPTLNVGGNFAAQTVAMGDMIGSANSAVQQLGNSDAGTAEALKQVLAVLEASKAAEGRNEVVAAVQATATSPTTENKRTLLERLKDYGMKAASVGTMVAGLDKAVEAIHGLLT